MQIGNDKILLILDLDETLIHADKGDCAFTSDFEVFGYKVVKRPYLTEFLKNCGKYFKVAVWSSASDEYVDKIVSIIKPDSLNLEFVWGRSRATYKPIIDFNETGYSDLDHFHYIKRLKKIKPLGFKLEKTLIVDDTPHKSKENYGNAIYIKEFNGETEDNELQILEEYLLEIKDCDDVRNIEKRGWRTKYETKYEKDLHTHRG